MNNYIKFKRDLDTFINESPMVQKFKKKKADNKRVNFVLNSEFDYQDHDINILKACLNSWTRGKNNIYSTFKYEWMYTDPTQKSKMYFISSTVGDLKRHKLLEKIMNNPEVEAFSYMNSYFSQALFYPYDLSVDQENA